MTPAHGVERALHFGPTETHVHQAARREVAALGCVSALARIPTFADLALDVLLAERLLGMEGVVGAAAHAQVPELARAAACSWDDVIQLEPGRRGQRCPSASARVQRSPSRSKTARRVARETRAVHPEFPRS